MTTQTDVVDPATITRAPWSEVGPEFMRAWGYPNGRRMPEHVAIYGPNGSGKSVFETVILAERARLRGSHVTIIATKPADATLTRLGWKTISHWPPDYNDRQVIFWVKGGLTAETQEEQRDRILALLSKLWVKDSNMIVSFDEIAYLYTDLGLRTTLTTYFREARALGITIVAGTQRPAGVTRWMHSETTWVAMFHPKDEDDALRFAELSGNRKAYLPLFMSLDRSKHEFVLLNAHTREMVITWIDQPSLPRPPRR